MKLTVQNIHANAEAQKILHGVNLTAHSGEIHAIMGPNGSGKSTLSKIIMGHPAYTVTRGIIQFNGKNILSMEPDERSRAGIFLAFQYPVEIPGVTLFSYLRTIYARAQGKAVKTKKKHAGAVKYRSESEEISVSVEEFQKIVSPFLKQLSIKEDFLERSLNEDFSGGEKKKAEILQLAVLRPKVIILDETDSGLDIDALRIVASGVKKFRDPKSIVIIITHYQRILRYIKPDYVHIMMDGRIVESGGYTLAQRIERRGYDEIKSKIKNKKSK